MMIGEEEEKEEEEKEGRKRWDGITTAAFVPRPPAPVLAVKVGGGVHCGRGERGDQREREKNRAVKGSNEDVGDGDDLLRRQRRSIGGY